MNIEELTSKELLDLYIDFVSLGDGIAPEAPDEAKAAYNEALKRGQKKLELWKKGIRLD